MDWHKRLLLTGCGLVMSLMTCAVSAEVVVVVSAQNPTSRLTSTELTDIFLGRVNRFPDGSRLQLIDQAEGVPERGEFYDHYLGRSVAQIKAHWSKLIFTGRGQPPRTLADSAAVIGFIESNDNAIGYIDSGLVDERVRVVAID